jgi:hypothetical protein
MPIPTVNSHLDASSRHRAVQPCAATASAESSFDTTTRRPFEKRYNWSPSDMADTAPKSKFGHWNHPSWWNLLVTLPWVLGLISLIYQAESNRQVAARERSTQAVVTAHEISNHNQFRYVFSVDGQNYSGLDSARGAELKVGDHVVVHYDSRNPSTNALTDFAALSFENLGPVPTVFVMIGVVAWLIARRRRQFEASESPSRGD